MKRKQRRSSAISFAVTAKFADLRLVFAYAKCWISHDAAQMKLFKLKDTCYRFLRCSNIKEYNITCVSLKRKTVGLFSSPAFIITFLKSSRHSLTP